MYSYLIDKSIVSTIAAGNNTRREKDLKRIKPPT